MKRLLFFALLALVAFHANAQSTDWVTWHDTYQDNQITGTAVIGGQTVKVKAILSSYKAPGINTRSQYNSDYLLYSGNNIPSSLSGGNTMTNLQVSNSNDFMGFSGHNYHGDPSRLTITFDKDVVVRKFSVGDIDGNGWYDGYTLSGYNFSGVESGNYTSSSITYNVTNNGFQFSSHYAPSVANGDAYARHKGTAVLSAGTPLVMSCSGFNNGSTFNVSNQEMAFAIQLALPCKAGTHTPTLNNSTNFNSSTNTYTIPCGSTTANLSGLSASNQPAGTSLTVHSSSTAANTNKYNNVTSLGTGTYYVAFNDATNSCYSPTRAITVVQKTDCCPAGTTAPAVNATVSNTCPSQTVNLNALHTGTIPAGGNTLVWFTNSTHSGTPVGTPTAVGAGSYYAFYYNSAQNCYSPASSPVAVTINSCPATGTINCDKTMIITKPVAGQAGQKALVIEVDIATVGQFPVAVSGSGFALANNPTVINATTTGVQKFYIPVNYNGSALGTVTVNTGVGNCTLDLTQSKNSKSAVLEIWSKECLPSCGPSWE